MTDAIIHRGPDAEGHWFSKRAALGHRRLIVIDPEGGFQPMLYKDGNDTIGTLRSMEKFITIKNYVKNLRRKVMNFRPSQIQRYYYMLT